MERKFDYIKKFLKYIMDNKEVAFLCVGSNKIIGDSIGPRVGSLLKKQSKFKNISILGDMKKAVNANNISEYKLLSNLENKYIIVIDSAMGKKETIGNIFISNKNINLGKALKKDIGQIGNISIKACVCEDLFNPQKNYYQLQRVDKNLVKKLTNEILYLLC